MLQIVPLPLVLCAALCGCKLGLGMISHSMNMSLRAVAAPQLATNGTGSDLALAALTERQYDTNAFYIYEGAHELQVAAGTGGSWPASSRQAGSYSGRLGHGTIAVDSATRTLTLTQEVSIEEPMDPTDSATVELQLDLDDAERVINDTGDLPFRAEGTRLSTETLPASGRVFGRRAGAAYDVAFTQDLKVVRIDQSYY
jgi:hypothetical protein